MASPTTRAQLIRQWKLVELLCAHKRGLTRPQVMSRLGSSKATFYRDLHDLRAAGVPVRSENQNGEARHSLSGLDLPPLGPSVTQLAALRLAQRVLTGLSGTRAARELDALLGGYPHASTEGEPITLPQPLVIAPELVRSLDRAIDAQRKTRIRYRSVRADKPDWRIVDPLGLRYARGQLYFIAYDHKRADIVPFKLDRLSKVEILKERAGKHRFDPNELFAHSAKIWTGPTHEVAVRLTSSVARFAREYPLIPDQTIEDQPGGAVIVRAKVAGLPEALRWVLSWGKQAEALSPSELRAMVAEEVQGAAARYEERARVHAFTPSESPRAE